MGVDAQDILVVSGTFTSFLTLMLGVLSVRRRSARSQVGSRLGPHELAKKPSLEELDGQMRRGQGRVAALHAIVRELEREVETRQFGQAIESGASITPEIIYHSIGTPLSQLSANTRIALQLDDLDVAETAQRLRKLAAESQDYIKAVHSMIQGFRRLSGVGEIDDGEPLVEVVQRLGQIYSKAHVGAELRADSLPPSLTGLPTIYAYLLLAPLIENAYEASDGDSLIEVRVDRDGPNWEIVVRNPSNFPLPTNSLESGRSTKAGHAGLGLSIVEVVAARVRASVSIKKEGGYVEVSVKREPAEPDEGEH